MAKFIHRLGPCIAPVQAGKMRRGTVKLKSCGEQAELKLTATRPVNIPGLLQVKAGENVQLCQHHGEFAMYIQFGG